MGAGAWGSTQVERVGGGAYRGDIGPEWVLAMVPQGGVVAALAARAMQAELGTDQQLRSLHGVFTSPVPAGPVEVRAHVLRAGRSASHAEATVHAPGHDTGFTALGVFGGTRPGFEVTALRYPDVPPPEACPGFLDPPPPDVAWEPREPWPFWTDVLEGRAAMGTPPWERSIGAAPECATWVRFVDQPLQDDGTLDPLSYLVLVDMMPGAVFEALGPLDDGVRWFAPSIDLSLHVFGPASPGWMLAHARAHHAGDGYASAEMALWDPRPADGPALVAWASQQMFFTRID
ncbi:MAG: thioesterase family protein [Acidimicrobiales bacterium]